MGDRGGFDLAISSPLISSSATPRSGLISGDGRAKTRKAIPLFVTSLSVPLLVVVLRVIRSAEGEDARRLSASEATKFIFSQMFNPTIMLLIGGFTIAAVGPFVIGVPS